MIIIVTIHLIDFAYYENILNKIIMARLGINIVLNIVFPEVKTI